jgi:hypothetical protein
MLDDARASVKNGLNWPSPTTASSRNGEGVP